MIRNTLLVSLSVVLTLSICRFASAASGQSPHRARALQYQVQGLFAKAVAEYRRAVEENPQDAASFNNAGLALKDMDLLDDAEAEIRTAIDLKPDNGNYHYNLGIIKLRQSNLQEAEQEFRQAVSLIPADPE